MENIYSGEETTDESVVSQSQAEKEVESWLDFKQVSQKRREEKKEQIKSLVGLLEEGRLVLDPEKFTLELNLSTPLKNAKQLIFAPRLRVHDLRTKMMGVKTDDVHGMIVAYAAALTGKTHNEINALDMEDYIVAQKVAGFFM